MSAMRCAGWRGGRLPGGDVGELASGDLFGFLRGYTEHAQEGFGELVDRGFVDLPGIVQLDAEQLEAGRRPRC
jgi:hypothetical protein